MGQIEDTEHHATHTQSAEECKHRQLEFMMWEPFYIYDRETGESDYSNGGLELKSVTCVDCSREWNDNDDKWPDLKRLFYDKVV
jgi:hypothetical protein